MAFRKIRIVIDAGHGGTDPGACARGYRECDRTLIYATLLASMLDKRYFDVKLTRNTNKFLYLTERANIANNFKADLFISLHMNSATTTEARGVETWIDWNTTKSGEIAKELQAAIAPHFTANRGVKMCDRNRRFTVLSHTNMAAVLIELGFISNTYDYELNVIKQKAIVQSMVLTINKHYNVLGATVEEDVPNTPAPAPVPTVPTVSQNTKLRNWARQYVVSYKYPTGNTVGLVQAMLQHLGYYKDRIDEHCGPNMIAAIRAFQSAQGLSVDGSCGPNTVNRLFDVLNVYNFCQTHFSYNLNSHFLSTAVAQTLLRRRGYYSSKVDGMCGPNTRNAIYKFQRAVGLASDSSCGPATFEKLFAML